MQFLTKALTTLLVASLAATLSEACLENPNVGNDKVTFMDVKYNSPTDGQSTWYYEVISGCKPAISHVTFQLSECSSLVDKGMWDGTDKTSLMSGSGGPEEGTDPTTGVTGLKFDRGFDERETRYYYFTINNNFDQGEIKFASKGGPGYDDVQITGPDLGCSVVGATEVAANDDTGGTGACQTDDDCRCDGVARAHDELKALLPQDIKFNLPRVDSGTDEAASYIDIKFSGTSKLSGLELDGYCIDVEHSIWLRKDYEGKGHYFTDTELWDTNIDRPELLEEAAWLINNFKPGIQYSAPGLPSPYKMSSGTIQRALWYTIDDAQHTGGLGSYNDDWAKYMHAQAVANGDGYRPGCDETIPIVLVPNDNSKQHLIAETTFTALGIECLNSCGNEVCNSHTCENGQCVVNTAADGTPCGDTSEDGCSGHVCKVGACVAEFKPAGEKCDVADVTDTDCDKVNTCDGNGVCQSNLEPDGTFCGSDPVNDCYEHDSCSVGHCTTGLAKAEGSGCDLGSGCSLDTCDGNGKCLPGCASGGAAASDYICDANLDLQRGLEAKCMSYSENPIEVISSTGVGGKVTFTIDQKWKTSGYSWTAVHRQLDGAVVCDKVQLAGPKEFTADCDQAGEGALVKIWMHDNMFTSSSKTDKAPAICGFGGNTKKKCQFFLEVPCNCAAPEPEPTEPPAECQVDGDCDWTDHDCKDLISAHKALKDLLPEAIAFTLSTDAGLDSEASYFDAMFQGNSALKGLQIDGWCIDVEHSISSGKRYTGMGYYFNDKHLKDTNIDDAAAIDEAAWLINHYVPGVKYEADINGDGQKTSHLLSSGTLQRALWYTIDDDQATAGLGNYNDEWARYLAREAVENGEGYMPGCDDIIPIIVVPDDNNRQHLLIETTFEAVGIECDASCASPACNVKKCTEGSCEVVPANDGEVCGSQGTECVFPDTCKMGQCVPGGLAPVDYMCGDQTYDDCDRPDGCDGFGECVANFEDNNKSCGEEPSNQCMYGGMCDGSGNCAIGEVPKPAGEKCDLGTGCELDECDGNGECKSGCATTGSAAGDDPQPECASDTECVPSGVLHDKKCPPNGHGRLFKINQGTTAESCRKACADYEGCNFYSWATSGSNYFGMCMGCSRNNPDSHSGFDFYPLERKASECTVHQCIAGQCQTSLSEDGMTCGVGTATASTCHKSECHLGECVAKTYEDGTPCGYPGDDCNTADVCKDGECILGGPVLDEEHKACQGSCRSLAQAHQLVKQVLPQKVMFKIDVDAGTDPDASYIDAELLGDPPLTGPRKIDGWSIDADAEMSMTIGVEYAALGYYYNDAALNDTNIDKPHMMQKVAWLLNNFIPGSKYVADVTEDGIDNEEEYILSSGTLQRAIWYIIDKEQSNKALGQFRDEWAKYMATQAITHGEDYVPGCNDIMPIVLVPDDNQREHLILETSFQALGVQCDGTCPDEECVDYQCKVVDGKGVCQATPKGEGTECGSAGDGECILHDYCRDGLCVTDVFAAKGTSCGSDLSSDCNLADSCDGVGNCLSNILADYTTCGDEATDCRSAGICMAGNCTYTNQDDGSPCGSPAGDCIQSDSCSNGECVAGGFKAEGSPCGSDISTPCNLPDTCDAGGNCQVNEKPDGSVCRAAGLEPLGDCWVNDTCTAGECIPPQPKAKGESCDTGYGCSQDTCDGEGRCQLACAVGLGAASDGASCKNDFFCAPTTPDACSVSYCNEEGVCETDKEDDGTPCGEPVGDGCTLSTCQDGVCTVGAAADGTECPSQCVSAEMANEALKQMLPVEFTFNLWIDPGTDADASYIDATFKGTSPLSGLKLDAWCIDVEHSIRVRRNYNGLAYHYSDPFLNTTNVDDSAALDEAAWLLNNYFPGTTYTADVTIDGIDNPTSYVMHSGTMQRALWYLIDDDQATSALYSYNDQFARYMAEEARAKGGGYTPGCSDIVPLVAIPAGGRNQHLLIETSFAQLGIACDSSCSDEEKCKRHQCSAGVCEFGQVADGTSCGALGSACVRGDTCQAGECVLGGPMEVGAACGSTESSDCDLPDTCDEQGMCNTNYVADETPCGPEPTECTERGTCQEGKCTDPIPLDDGTPCGSDGSECVDPDRCEAGVCVEGQNSPKGKLCGDQYSDECNKADVCDGEGQCDSNLMPDGTECGETQTNQCINPNQCQGGICTDGVNKTKGEHCDLGINCPSDTCNGEGVCELGCAVGISAASDVGDPCTSDEQCQPSVPSDNDDCRDYVCNGVCEIIPKPADTLCGKIGGDLGFCEKQDKCNSDGICEDGGYDPSEYLFTCGDTMYVCGRYVNPDSCGEKVTETLGGCEPECRHEYCDELISLVENGDANIFAATCENGKPLSRYARYNCLGLDGHSYTGSCDDESFSIKDCPIDLLVETEVPCGGNSFVVSRRFLRNAKNA